MGMVHSYRDLVAWQKAMELVTEVYQISQTFPNSGIFGLISQLRRAAISIPGNPAEGHGKSTRENCLFLSHARGGSLAELETQILTAKNLDYLSESDSDQIRARCAEVGRILNGFLSSLKKK